MSLTSQVQTAGGSLAGNEHSPISSTVGPRCFPALSRDGRAAVSNVRTVASPEGVISIKVCSGYSGSACSDEPAHGQPSTRACYLGWTTSELLGELADARVAVVDESKQQSHLSGGVLTALKHAEHPVECGVRPGHRRVATG